MHRTQKYELLTLITELLDRHPSQAESLSPLNCGHTCKAPAASIYSNISRATIITQLEGRRLNPGLFVCSLVEVKQEMTLHVNRSVICRPINTHTERRAGLNQEKPFFEVKPPGSLVPWVKSRIRCELANPPLLKLSAPSSGSAAAPAAHQCFTPWEGGRQKHFCVLRRGAFSPVMHISSRPVLLVVRIRRIGRLRGRHAHTDTLHGYETHRSITQSDLKTLYLDFKLTFLQRGCE